MNSTGHQTGGQCNSHRMGGTCWPVVINISAYQIIIIIIIIIVAAVCTNCSRWRRLSLMPSSRQSYIGKSQLRLVMRGILNPTDPRFDDASFWNSNLSYMSRRPSYMPNLVEFELRWISSSSPHWFYCLFLSFAQHPVHIIGPIMWHACAQNMCFWPRKCLMVVSVTKNNPHLMFGILGWE